MRLRLLMVLVVLSGVFASSALTARAASTTSSCSNYGFEDKSTLAVHQLGHALDFWQVESYRTAEAWALRSWQTMRATAPCRSTYRRFRQYELNGSAAIWNAVKAERRGDSGQVVKLLGQAQRWGDLAAAEEATW
jgi:hypothetical protein